jgi:hypothetical protein
MNIKSPLLALLGCIALTATATSVGFAQQTSGEAGSVSKNEVAASNTQAGKLIRVSDKEAAWAAQARKSYPLDVCVVSDEKLGSMGKSPEYIYRVDGQPDRLVVFCCSGCDEDFLKAPDAHLAKIDAARSKRE